MVCLGFNRCVELLDSKGIGCLKICFIFLIPLGDTSSVETAYFTFKYMN